LRLNVLLPRKPPRKSVLPQKKLQRRLDLKQSASPLKRQE
jgi:hypothetical protein